jgi:predicted patatin/cPLA2 family phospholipase
MIFGGSYFNLPYIYGTLGNSDGENPLDYEAYEKNKASFFVVAEDAVSGNAVYFNRNHIKKDDCRVLMASSSIPGINKPFEIDGKLYFDGALADPVPIQRAFMEGCDRVVLLLSKPMDEPIDYQTDVFLSNLIKNQYPVSARKLMLRAEKYERSIALANQYASMNRLLFIAPNETFGITATKRTKNGLESLYALGKEEGKKISAWLKN